MTSSDLKSGLSAATPAQRAEAIMSVLQALCRQGEPVVAQLGEGEPAFRSRLRFVDPQRQYIVVDASDDAAASAALLAQTRVAFHSMWDEWRIEFSAAEPQVSMHEGAAAIRLRFPEAVTSHHRRAAERVPVPLQAPLRCVASVDDVVFFEAIVADISLGGIGVLQFGPDIALQAGTVIRGCRIERPGRPAVGVDIEVRYTGPAAFPDGRPARRAGCRFMNLSPPSVALAELVAEYSGRKR